MMLPRRKNLLLLLIYLVIGSAAGVFLTTFLMSLLVDVYLYVTEKIKIDVYSYDLKKLFKVSLFCGVVGGGGCWWIYYQHYRKSKRK